MKLLNISALILLFVSACAQDMSNVENIDLTIKDLSSTQETIKTDPSASNSINANIDSPISETSTENRKSFNKNNNPPAIIGKPGNVVEINSQYIFSPVIQDPDGDSLHVTVVNLPEWLSLDRQSGIISGTPKVSQEGVYSDIIYSVSDGQNKTSLGPFSIEVRSDNQAPSISGSPSLSVNENSSYYFLPTAVDLDNDVLTFSIINKPSHLVFNSSSGELSGVFDAAGVYKNIGISVTDGLAVSNLPLFSITVNNTNRIPIILGSPSPFIYENTLYTFQPTANDADNDGLTFSISNQPVWAQFDENTGKLSGTPSASDVGLYDNIIILVSDGFDVVALAPFSIEVQKPISGSSLLIFNISKPGYTTDKLNVDTLAYNDRAYTISALPSQYMNSEYIRTNNDDKLSATNSFLSFDINIAANIFLAIDERILPLPGWLLTWEVAGTNIEVGNSTYVVYKKLHSPGNVVLGGNFGGSSSSMYLVFAQQTSGSTPLAKPDVAATDENQSVIIPVLQNDTNLEDAPVSVEIVETSGNAVVIVQNNEILYTPKNTFVGSDTFIYRVTDVDGDFSLSNVTVDVTCSSCITGPSLNLVWDANPVSENVVGYNIYLALNNSASFVLIRNISVTDAGFSPLSPSTT
ncbi:MAG: Ig-like domain-containing protein, partial [Gammaproteobacteria bacterium]|nr:Ig-like domain-containing protein [Gammaproteobacteria bacterium]